MTIKNDPSPFQLLIAISSLFFIFPKQSSYCPSRLCPNPNPKAKAIRFSPFCVVFTPFFLHASVCYFFFVNNYPKHTDLKESFINSHISMSQLSMLSAIFARTHVAYSDTRSNGMEGPRQPNKHVCSFDVAVSWDSWDSLTSLS